MRAAAFHEAGHAVAAYHLRVRLRRISIGLQEGEALGWLDLWLPHVTLGGADNIRRVQAVERDVIVLLAGAHAERLGAGRSGPGGGLDFYEAARRAESICRTSEEMSAFLRWLQLRTRALVEMPTWRQPIEALAERLLSRRQLGAREVRAVIRAAVAGPQHATVGRGSRGQRLSHRSFRPRGKRRRDRVKSRRRAAPVRQRLSPSP